jgi:two-component system, OmpR family, response regulator
MATAEPVRVLVVDDEPSIRDFLQLGLQYEGFAVAMAGDGNTALRMVREFRPHLVVLDVMLPGMDGWAVGEALRNNPDVLIIYLTARDEVADRVRGLELGADDYMVKPFSFQELVARIRLRLRKRGQGATDSKRQVGDLELDEATRDVRYQGRSVSLSPREFDLLRTLMVHAGQVLSKQQLLDIIWGHDYFGDDNVVEVYIRYLRDKLGDREFRLIRTVRGVGYKLEG